MLTAFTTNYNSQVSQTSKSSEFVLSTTYMIVNIFDSWFPISSGFGKYIDVKCCTAPNNMPLLLKTRYETGCLNAFIGKFVSCNSNQNIYGI